MDDTLKTALEQYLGRIIDPVVGLLAVEVDWGAYSPPITDKTTPITFQGATWGAVLTDSELVLRRALCNAYGNRIIWLLTESRQTRIPLDIQARLHGQTVHRLGLRARLHAVTGRDWPAEVDHAEWRPTVERRVDYLVRNAGQPGTLNWSITHNELEGLLLRAAFGVEPAGKSAPQVLANLTAFQQLSASPPDALELAILESHLRADLPAEADTLAWAAAELGRAESLVRTGLMMAAERDARLAPNWGGLNALRGRLVGTRQTPEAEAMAGVMALAVAALELLPRPQMKALVEAAERDLTGVLPVESYVRWFPKTLSGEIDRLAKRLAEGHLPSADRITELRSHLFAADQAERLNALEKMIAVVAGRRQQTNAVAGLKEAHEGVSAWAEWYGQHGSPIDLAALELMRSHGQGAELTAAATRVLHNHWAWRDDLNRMFAERYLAGYEDALHDRNGAFGTHHILRWAVRPLLEAGQRVLLVIVDGMSFPDFWHLAGLWASAKKPAYPSQVHPALALLPSVTSVSRRAIFLDKLPTDRLDDEDAYEQKARTSEVEALTQSLHGQAARLYNKSNLDVEQLLQDLQSRTLACIALIVNGIDDDLKNSATSVRLSDLRDLEPLDSAVQTALDADWAVLITADHGHTWHRDKKLRRGPQAQGGGERFAPLAQGGGVPDGAVATADPNIVRMQSGQKVALLTASGAYFGQNPRRGYHGGASLEEVIVPRVLLTRQPPAGFALAAGSQTPAATESETPGLAGVVLTLRSGSTVSVTLPFSLEPLEARLLQALAHLGEASEGELRNTLRTRRIAGPLAALRENLASHGLDYIEDKGSGPEGAIYRFRDELLPRGKTHTRSDTDALMEG